MRHGIKTSLFALCAGLLAACSSGNGTPEFSRVLISALREGIQKTDTTAANQAVLAITRAQVETSAVPLLRVYVEDRDARATLVEVSRNRGARTYFTGDEASLTFRNGFLIRTGSFGGDLMGLGLSVDSLKAAAAAGELTRSYRYLGALNEPQRLDVSCRLTTGQPMILTILERNHRVVPVRETCSGDGVYFENAYWMESGSGVVWKSTQWVGPFVGQITTEVLKREP